MLLLHSIHIALNLYAIYTFLAKFVVCGENAKIRTAITEYRLNAQFVIEIRFCQFLIAVVGKDFLSLSLRYRK